MNKKRMLAFLLALVLGVGLVSAPALAADARPEFEIEGTELMRYNGPGGDVVIPDGVTRIGVGAFEFKYDLTSVTIPASVKEMGWGVFFNDLKLTSIRVSPDNAHFASVDGVLFDKSMTKLIQYPLGKQGAYAIPAGVATIGDSAFDGCAGLSAVTIPAGVTAIGSTAFSGCTGLESVTLPAGVTAIGSNAFAGCRNLKRVVIPEGVTAIEEAAFYQCGLESVALPNSVTDIGMRAFAGCAGLESVTLPSGLTAIAGSAFDSCEKLKAVTIPAGVTAIGESAFGGCAALTSVTIPEGVTAIGKRAFQNCTGLSRVSLPKSAASIGVNAFYGTPWLEQQGDFAIANGTLLRYQGQGGTVTIPEGVNAIGEEAFAECTDVTGVTVPEGVTAIGHNAFKGCTALAELSLPSTITWMGTDALSSTPWLKTCASPLVVGKVLVYVKSQEQTFTVPEGVTVIGPDAFRDCGELRQITIPASVTSDKLCQGCFRKFLPHFLVIDNPPSLC